jgi:hypothetical protein
MALGGLTQLATGVAPELIGVQAKLCHRRVVGRTPQRRAIAGASQQFDAVD